MCAKMSYDSIVRCANYDCYHNRDGYNYTCSVITVGADGKCALFRPKLRPKPNPNKDPFEGSNAC